MKILKCVVQLLLLFFSFAYITAYAAPTAPTLIGPKGMISSQPPVFEWDALENTSWYRVWVKDDTGVIVADWVKDSDVCNQPVVGICNYSPGIAATGTAIWQVRGFENGELGPWSTRTQFFEALSRPQATTLQAPLTFTSNTTPTFSWTLVPEATWYKIEIIDTNETTIASSWLNVGKGDVSCNTNTNTCSKTPMIIIPGSFEWRVRTYNAAGLGPWAQSEFVNLVPGGPLSATPNPLVLGLCTFEFQEFMVTNNSSSEITDIVVQPSTGDFILAPPIFEEVGFGEFECYNEIEELAPGESCVITRVFVGDSPVPGSQTITVTGVTEGGPGIQEDITALAINIELAFDNCDDVM